MSPRDDDDARREKQRDVKRDLQEALRAMPPEKAKAVRQAVTQYAPHLLTGKEP